MVTVRNIGELEQALKNPIRDAISRCGKVAEIKLKENILKAVYDSFEPDYYERTYDLLESVTMTPLYLKDNSGNYNWTSLIWFNSDKIDPLEPTEDNSNWNMHMSVDYRDVTNWIAKWVEFGTEGSLWDRKPSYVFRSLVTFLEINYKDMFIREMRNEGFKIK